MHGHDGEILNATGGQLCNASQNLGLRRSNHRRHICIHRNIHLNERFMKNRNSFLLPVLCALGLIALFIFDRGPVRAIDRQAINPLIGDISYVSQFGENPDAATDEHARIRAHLAYVEQRLRGVDVAHLSATQRAQRTRVLDLLRDYWMAGIFPRNYDHKGERRPCFIDRDGRICAVGYLVEQTAGRAAAEAINQKHQYQDLLAMNDPALDEWVAGSGLSKVECAMIQPTYGWSQPQTDQYVSPATSIATASFTGVTGSINLLNGVQLLKGQCKRAIPIMGIVAGVGQVGLGIGMMPGQPVDTWTPYPQRQHQLAMMNIGLGTSTILLSTYNLIANHKPKQKPLALNVYGYPTGHQSMAMGLGFSKRF
jgi:hypothetical protein